MIDFEFEFQYAEEKQPTLQKVGGSIPAGRCVVLCGGSGCGKSTLLRCINGLIPQFYEGELKGFCRLNGQDTAGIRIGEIGELAASVFQDPRSQFFTVNSSNEVAFGLENHGLPQGEIRRRVDDTLSGVSFSVREHEIVGLVGANGCGKTTIGKLMAGLNRPSGGRITLFGKQQNPKQLQKQVLFILQEAEFQFFTNSVLHELQYGHAVTPEFEAKTETLLKSMDMWDCRNRHPFSLSGGQMQRLTLMMAYLSDKPIVILDEPTAGQDAESLERCAALIREMRKEKTVLIITHDPELIAGACDRCIGLSDGHAEIEFPVHSERDLQAVRQYMERFHLSNAPAKKQHKERFHPATKLLYWLALLVVISTSNNHLVYAVYTALILLTAADGWLGTALAGGMSFGLLWAANALLPGTVFSFMLVLFPRIIAVGISMRTLIGRNEASRTLAALRNLRLPERLIMIVAVIFRFFPVLSGDMKLLRQSIRTRGAFVTPWQKLRALPSYIEILTVPMALRVIRIAETLSASAETRGIDLTRRKSNYLSLRFSAWDAVFCVLLAASIAAGLIL